MHTFYRNPRPDFYRPVREVIQYVSTDRNIDVALLYCNPIGTAPKQIQSDSIRLQYVLHSFKGDLSVGEVDVSLLREDIHEVGEVGLEFEVCELGDFLYEPVDDLAVCLVGVVGGKTFRYSFLNSSFKVAFPLTEFFVNSLEYPFVIEPNQVVAASEFALEKFIAELILFQFQEPCHLLL